MGGDWKQGVGVGGDEKEEGGGGLGRDSGANDRNGSRL
jgi:hypothetical protein